MVLYGNYRTSIHYGRKTTILYQKLWYYTEKDCTIVTVLDNSVLVRQGYLTIQLFPSARVVVV